MTIATDLERYLLDLMNAARAQIGVHALTLEQNLNASADAHTQWMLDTGTFSHSGLNGSRAVDRMALADFDLGTSWDWAENIGAEQVSNAGGYFDEVDSIFQVWMNSPTHRTNILNSDLDVVGLGIIYGTLPPAIGPNLSGIMATQNFGASNGLYDLDILGESGADTLAGGAGDDDINGAAGSDVIMTHAGADYVAAGEGNDMVNAGTGNDTVSGNAGHDTLTGGDGNDDLSGGDGDDLLAGGADTAVHQDNNGNDTVIGTAQADMLLARAGDDRLEGGAGDDRLFGGSGDDSLFGGIGADVLFGNAGNDQMFGQDGDDRAYGAGGNDLISDGAGNDLLDAGAGFDTLNGGAGNDTLFGGADADHFVFTDTAGGFGHDTIADFAASDPNERIDLSNVAAITTLSDLLSNHTQQIGADVRITADTTSTILLVGVDITQLDSTNFIF